MFEHDFKTYPELTNAQMIDLQYVSPHQQITSPFDATVVKVHDGDTITVRTSFRDFDFPVRCAEIDAPELNTGDTASKAWLKDKIEGQQIRIEPTKERVEKWGRLIGKLIYNGMSIGEEMIFLGLAVEYEHRNDGEIINIVEKYKWLDS